MLTISCTAKRWLLALVVLIWVFALFIPRLALDYAETWLLQHGASEVSLHRFGFNPFTGHLFLKDLKVSFPQESPLSLSHFEAVIRWRDLWFHRLHLQHIRLTDADTPLEVSSRRVRVGALTVWDAQSREEPAAAQDQSDWQLRIDRVQISSWRLPSRVDGVAVDLSLDDLGVGVLDTGKPGTPVSIDLRARINGSSLSLKGKAKPFAEPAALSAGLSWDALKLSTLAPLLGDRLTGLGGQLSGRSTVQITASQTGLEVGQEGALSATALMVPELLEAGRLHWTGETHYRSKPQADEPTFRARGGVEAEHLKMLVVEPSPELAKAVLQDIDFSGDGGVSIGQASLQGITLENPNVAQAPWSLTGLEADSVDYKRQEGVAVAEIRLTDLSGTLLRDAEGIWQLPLPAGKQKAQPVGHAASGGSPAFRVGEIRLQGTNPLRIVDYSVAPAVNNTLFVDQLQIKHLDSEDSAQWSPFQLLLRQGDYGEARLSGQFRLQKDGPELSLKGSLKQLELYPWSPYSVEMTGYQVNRGVLEGSLQLDVEQQQLQADTEFDLIKLKLEAVDQQRARETDRSISMPLPGALSLLRDSDDRIHLKLPVNGSLDAPDFDLADIIGKALGRVLARASLAYLKYTLQPYGALITIGELVGKQIGKIHLAPVSFEPGHVTLHAEQLKYLDKIAELLIKRPALQLSLCGVAVMADLGESVSPTPEKLNEQTRVKLVAMAEQRAANIKKTLLETAQIDSGRLLVCQPRVERDKTALPRVDIGL